MSLISCAQMVGKPRMASDPAAAPAMAAPDFRSARRLSLRARDFVPAPSLLDPFVSTMATLVGYDELSQRSDRSIAARLATRLSTEFFEVKLEGKISRISRTNVLVPCTSFRHSA